MNGINYNTITESFTLPSKGLIYEQPINPDIELRSMIGREELRRLNPSAMPFKTLAGIINDCCIEKPSIHVYDMCLKDYEFLLHKLRHVTYGDDYRMSVICPYCGTTLDHTFDLSTLATNVIDMGTYNKHKTFTLPQTNAEVSLKYQTPHMLDIISNKSNELREKFPDAGVDFNTQVLLTTVIDTIDGASVTQTEMERFVNEIPAKDMLTILHHIDLMNNDFGIDTTFYTKCTRPDCKHTVKTFFRIGSEFFRPTFD